MSLMAVAEWLGGPMDGLRTPIRPDATEYAVAFDHRGRVLDHPRAQRYVDDPSFWLKDTRPNVALVRVYAVDRECVSTESKLVIRWREVPDREFDARG